MSSWTGHLRCEYCFMNDEITASFALEPLATTLVLGTEANLLSSASITEGTLLYQTGPLTVKLWARSTITQLSFLKVMALLPVSDQCLPQGLGHSAQTNI